MASVHRRSPVSAVQLKPTAAERRAYRWTTERTVKLAGGSGEPLRLLPEGGQAGDCIAFGRHCGGGAAGQAGLSCECERGWPGMRSAGRAARSASSARRAAWAPATGGRWSGRLGQLRPGRAVVRIGESTLLKGWSVWLEPAEQKEEEDEERCRRWRRAPGMSGRRAKTARRRRVGSAAPHTHAQEKTAGRAGPGTAPNGAACRSIGG